MVIEDKPPAMLNGKRNPAYARWYHQTEGYKAARRRYQESVKGKLPRGRASFRKNQKETSEQYADRIMRWLGDPDKLY